MLCIYSVVRCLFRSFAHFLVGWFVFFLLGFKGSLYILNTCPLSDVCLEKYFFPVDTFLPVYNLTVYSLNIPFRAEVFNLKKISLRSFEM